MSTRRKLAVAVVGGVLIGVAAVAAAQTSAFQVAWHSVDGGGGASSGAAFELLGVSGQPDAGTLTGGGYRLAGGFLLPAAPADAEPLLTYLPTVWR
jgi:hypothetical protein